MVPISSFLALGEEEARSATVEKRNSCKCHSLDLAVSPGSGLISDKSLWGIWTTNDTKGGERRERVSCFSWFFACFAIQSTDAEIDALACQLLQDF